MSKTYGDNSNFPGVKVHLESGDVSPAPKLPDLSERGCSKRHYRNSVDEWITVL